MEVWMENLNIEEVIRCYNIQPPKINISSSLHYELISDFFYFESAYLIVRFDPVITFDKIENILDESIESWNNESESMNRNKGVFHNNQLEESGIGFLNYYIDFGSAYKSGLAHILNQLNEIKEVESVKVTSYK
jgi:hypothetical protein